MTLLDNIFIFLGNISAIAVLAFASGLIPWTKGISCKETSKILLCATYDKDVEDF